MGEGFAPPCLHWGGSFTFQMVFVVKRWVCAQHLNVFKAVLRKGQGMMGVLSVIPRNKRGGELNAKLL